MMLKSPELPDCRYLSPPVMVRPANPTPKHTLYLSNLDDQNFLRFSIKYVFLFEKGVSLCNLKRSLAIVLEHYYPFAGRLRVCGGGASRSEFDRKLEVECNGEGAVFAEGFMDLTAEEFLRMADTPNRSWRKLLYRFETLGFLDIPPLVLQVTNLRCGGMILCTGINHCLSDGVGTSQFLHAWAHLTSKPNLPLPIIPFHFRHVFKPRNPLHVTFHHPQYSKTTPSNNHILLNLLRSLPLRPVSVVFSGADILRLKRRCTPSLKCTSFEALAAHTWQSWLHSLATAAVISPLPPSLLINLLFSVNVRRHMHLPEPPSGFYGNAFVLACAQSTVKDLTANATVGNIHHSVTLVQQAKAAVTEEYVRSVVDMLDDRNVRTDMSATLVISQWSKLGLEDLDFGEGKPIHMGPLASDIYCLFLPVSGDLSAVRVLVSVPECVAHKFEYYMKGCCYTDHEDEHTINNIINSSNNSNGQQNGFI
ncbi:unnamed protein product [Citrullus colocynthis]|uniref:Omega-hydroxypalmitate O-feruloyl transferase n=1 Tax=Citrullus colocynthis TaxID=252529 RepID=A0ABP0XWZ4_9ROSI